MADNNQLSSIVAIPAKGLRIVGILSGIGCCLGALVSPLRLLTGGQYGGRAFLGMALDVAFYVPWFLVSVLVFRAGNDLMRFQNRNNIMLAAVLATVPVCIYTFVWPISVVFGVWTIIVLRRPEVKAAFQ